MQAQRALNPLFLRDAELERSLAHLALLQLELETAVAGLLERAGLEPGDQLLLARIAAAPGPHQPPTAAELALYLGWTKQRMSRRLRHLALRGHVVRATDRVDRRKQHVQLTEVGRRHVAEAQGLQKRLLRRVFRRAGAADVAGFQHVLVVAAQGSSRGRQVRRAVGGAGPDGERAGEPDSAGEAAG